MTTASRSSRTLAMQLLCQGEVQPERNTEFIRQTFELVNTTEDDRNDAMALCQRYWQNPAAVDGLISKAASSWKIERMMLVDRNVIRVATLELLQQATPPPVVLNEAIDIAREFGGDSSHKFVNAVLDTLLKQLVVDGVIAATAKEIRKTKTKPVMPSSDEQASS